MTHICHKPLSDVTQERYDTMISTIQRSYGSTDKSREISLATFKDGYIHGPIFEVFEVQRQFLHVYFCSQQ